MTKPSIIEMQKQACKEASDWNKIVAVGLNNNIMAISSEKDGTWVIWQNITPSQIKKILAAIDCPEQPAPAYQVGDWVRTEDGDFCVKKVPPLPDYGDLDKVIYRYRGKLIIKKLSPSEVIVPISIKGQIRPGCNESCFEISTPNGGWMEIGKEQITKDELEIVESLLKAQEKGDIK